MSDPQIVFPLVGAVEEQLEQLNCECRDKRDSDRRSLVRLHRLLQTPLHAFRDYVKVGRHMVDHFERDTDPAAATGRLRKVPVGDVTPVLENLSAEGRHGHPADGPAR